MASSLFGIGISGLNSAQAGLITTGHNIANVNTPGYSRQVVVQGTNAPFYTGAGYFGTGVHVQTVKREYDAFLEIQARQTQAAASHLERYATQIGRLDQLLADLDGGLSKAFDEFFESINEVAAYPRDAAARQSMLSASNALVARFQALEAELVAARRDVNSQLEINVANINSIANRIAELNARIALHRAHGNGLQEPNDLLDQRDTLVRELNKLIGAKVVEQDDGSYNVFIGNGQALVVRDRANRLVLQDDPAVPGDKQIALDANGLRVPLTAAQLTGGEVGGLLEFRDQTLNVAHNALGRIAMTLAAEFNAQHALGLDLNGQPGGQFFALAQPLVHASILNGGNAQLQVTVSDYGALTASDYRLTYDGTQYHLTRLPENTTQSFAALPVDVDGLRIEVAGGTMAPGDSFVIQPTRAGAAQLAALVHDTQAIAAAAPIKTAAALDNTGNATISAGRVDAGYTHSNTTYVITFAVSGGTTTYTVDTVPTSGGLGTGTYTSGATIDFLDDLGIHVEITGVPADGDSFTVSPNDGTADNRNALALAALQTKNVMAGGTATLQGGYAQLVSAVGNKTREVQVTSEAQNLLLKDTLAARESVAGVNLDEEAANLIRYQQAYQAAGKVIAVAGTLFDSILEILR
ncbi:MAG: flagellar hook-associated protein FlgK [Pseudomonadota bacterium]